MKTEEHAEKTEKATRLMQAMAPFRCTYCDKHYNRQSLQKHLKKIQWANELSSRSNSSPMQNSGAIPTSIIRDKACRLLTCISATCVLPVAAEAC